LHEEFLLASRDPSDEEEGATLMLNALEVLHVNKVATPDSDQ